MSEGVGADEALDSLVGQFADPLSLLRELVQNSLDASSTQIDVDFAYESVATGKKGKKTKGVMRLSVTDNGEGMNEQIIDKHLLTLFSSTKEDDLTKIGKFGVGFVSIFALEPDLVVLETGQSSESWRILFHADRSYEKIRLDEPVEGTEITLHKRVKKSEFEELRTRGADTVRYWCKYADAEIFVDGEIIGEPFGIEGALETGYTEPGTEIMLALAPIEEPTAALLDPEENDSLLDALRPTVGFYNRGLTLIEASELAAEEYADLVGVSLRVKSRYLEHTLTRDNVRQDENFHTALTLVRAQVEGALRAKLIAHLEALAAHHSGDASGEEPGEEPGGPGYVEALLYATLPSMQLAASAPRAPILPTVDGEPVSLRALRRSKSPLHDEIVYGSRSTPLTRLLATRGVPVLLDGAGAVEFARACGLRVVSANRSLYTAEPVESDELMAKLLGRTDQLLDRARMRVGTIHLGNFDYAQGLMCGQLFIRQREPYELTEVGDDEPGFLGGARQIVLAHEHRLVLACRTLAERDLDAAALLLAEAICTDERADRKRASRMARMSLGWHTEAVRRTNEEQER